MKLSKDGYKRNSKDVNNPYNIIPSGDITMKGVDFPVMGTDNLGNQQLMQPGFDYKFPGNMVFEQPVQDKPTNKVKQRRIERDNKLLPNYNKQMGDVSTHLMTTIEMTDDDGSPIYMAIPMLYPTVEGQETPDPASWTEFQKGQEQDAFKMALERGEVYYFNSAEEADAFAKGGYKTPNLKKRKHGGEDSKDDNDQLGIRNALQAIKPILGKTFSKFLPLVNMFKPLEAGRGSTLSDLHFSNQLPDVVEMDEDDMQVYEILLGKKVPEQGLLFQSPEFDEFSKALILAHKADSIENSIAEQYNIPNYQSTGEVDNTEVKDYFTAYLKSPLFKRRAIDLHGEDNWESVRDAKLERLKNTEVDFSGEEEWLEIFNQENPTLRDILYAERTIPKIQSRYKSPNYNDEGNENPIIKVNPGQAITMGEDHNLSYNPFNSIVANEYSHALGATSGKYDPFPYPMTEEEIQLSEQRKPNAPYDSHDSNFWEMKSDIDTTRYELWKAGLYNFEEDFMFDQSHIDYIRNNPNKFIKDENLFKQYDDDVIIDQMNIYTDVGTTPFAVGKFGTELPKAQWYNPFDPKYKTLYQGVKNLFSSSPKYPKGTHNFTNAPKFPVKYRQKTNIYGEPQNDIFEKPIMVNLDGSPIKKLEYETFPEWRRYIDANQPINVNYQLPTLVNDPNFNKLINDKGLINTNSLKSYINKTKGLNNVELYDRQKLKSVFESLDLNNQKFVDENTFLKEAAKYTEPLPIFPNLKTVPLKSKTEFAAYWEGSNNPFTTYQGESSVPDPRGPKYTDAHVLQTYLPTSPGVPMWDRSIGSTHYDPFENPSITRKVGNKEIISDPEGLGGLTLGHSRIAFDPSYPNTTVEIERQSDYAQKFNLAQPKSAANPLGLNERDQYIDKLKTGEDNIVPNTKKLDEHKEFMVELNAMSDKDLLNEITTKSGNQDFQTLLAKNLSKHHGPRNPKTGRRFFALTNDELFTVAKSPEFKNYLKRKENQLKKEYDKSVLKYEDDKYVQKTELYNIENPNELSLNLKEYRKNAPVILLNELIDYSTKIGNTHLHIPLAETVAKVQGYDADKFGAPNPLYNKHKWTGHSWNDFLNKTGDLLDKVKTTGRPNKETLGPFTFEKNKDAIVVITYKKPDGNIINVPRDGTDTKSKLEVIRNNFLKNEGYDPDVDYKSDSGAYKSEHQSILNKSTEKEIKKNIEAIFGKNYPYEIITDARDNKYIRLDHTGTRLPIKGLQKYKKGGSLHKAQYQLIDDVAKLLGKADDYKNILPSPTISTVPYQRLLTFDQTGKVIPQQHMVNPFRGENALNDALNDLYSGQPMWFAPVGDTRYFDRSLEAFVKVNEDALNFVPGSGRPILRYITDQKGNTGKWGVNEYPLTDAEKLTKINKGYDYKWVVDENGNGKYVVDYDSPIMRQEFITKPDFQSKIIGDFAPDIKFKIFKDFDLSRQGHAMHKVWQPEEFQSILDEGFDAIQLVKDGVQIENILLNPDKFKIRSINEMPVTIDNPPFATGGTLPKAQLQVAPKAVNQIKSILQRPFNFSTWTPNTGSIPLLNIGASSASNYSANALENLRNLAQIKDQELLNSLTQNYSKIYTGDVNAQNQLEEFAKVNPEALISLGQSDDPYLNAIMNRNKNISIGSYAGAGNNNKKSELYKNMVSYNPQGLLIENIPTLSGGTTNVTMGPNVMQGNVDPIHNLFVPAKGAGAWQGTNQHTYLMSQTKRNPSLIVSGDKGFVSRGNDTGFQGRFLSRGVGPNRLNANWDSNYGIRGTIGQSLLDKVGLLDESFKLDEPFKGTFMQFYNPPKRDGGQLPKHQIPSLYKGSLKLLNPSIKSVNIVDKTNPFTVLGYGNKYRNQGSNAGLLTIDNRADLINQYNLRNNQYRTININDKVLNNEELRSAAEFAGYNPNAADELAAYLGTTPTGGTGRRTGFESAIEDNAGILYTGDYPHITSHRYTTGNPQNAWTVKSNLWEDDIAKLSDQEIYNRISLLDQVRSHDPSRNIFDIGDIESYGSLSNIKAPHGSILNTQTVNVPELMQTNMIYGDLFKPVRKPISLIRNDDLNKSLQISGDKFQTFKKGGSIKDRYKKKLPKFQMQGQNNPGWLANRLYKSVTPIGYNMDQAMVEMLYGERQPFMWDGVETSFDNFQNHPRFKDNPNFGEYIKKASEDLWGMYLGFDQKHNTVSKSKFKPTLGVEDNKSIYYSFNNVDDIMDDIIERGITKDASKDKWQINDSAAGGFNLSNYQISRGMDDERELPYYAYYDEYDFDIPTGLGFNIEGESIVGKPFNIYGRIYYHPDTKELIPPSELNANWVDFEKLKQGVAYAESLNGELMINPESTATGLYGQRFSEISTMYDGSRQDFANDIEAQNEYFENRYRGKLEGVIGLKESGIDLYKEYSKQIPNFPYTTTEVAALVNFLGRQGTREYLGYVLRDGNSLESVFPDKYGVNAGQANKTPQEYIEKFNEGITKKKMGGEVDKVTDRLIKKYENGDKLTPAGTKHLKSLGMI